jgi:hypothetical protein
MIRNKDITYEAEYHQPSAVLYSRESIGPVPMSNMFSLRRICRQIRAETTETDLCTSNIFNFGDRASYNELSRFRLTKSQRVAVRTIIIDNAASFHAEVYECKRRAESTIPFRVAFPKLEQVLLRLKTWLFKVRVGTDQIWFHSKTRLFISQGLANHGVDRSVGLESDTSVDLEFGLVRDKDIRVDGEVPSGGWEHSYVVNDFDVRD